MKHVSGFADLQIRFAPEIRQRSADLADAIDRMADPPAPRDLELARHAAHKLKGSALTIAFDGVADAVGRVEQALDRAAGPDLPAAARAAHLAVREARDCVPPGADAHTAAVGATSAADAEDVAAHGERELVVVIDDDEASVGFLKLVIGAQPGVRFLAAASGAKGLEVVRNRQPGLVLLDLGLPDCNGEALLPRLCAAAPDARIVVLSGDASREAELRAAGADDVIQKPVGIARLRALVGA